MTTRIYRSTDLNAPQLTFNTSGALISVLDAVLVNGITSYTPVSITRSGSTATVTTSVAHNYKKYTKINVAGCNETAYNGEWSITPVTATTYTYDLGTAVPAVTATGTITCQQLSSGWTKPYTSGVNICAYRPGAGTQFYLQVRDDQGATYNFGAIRGYETMSDYQTGTNPFPTVAQMANGLSVYKDTATRAWTIWATNKCIYMYVNIGGNSPATAGHLSMFGDFTSYKTADAFNCMIHGGINALTTSPSTSSQQLYSMSTTLSGTIPYHYICRGYDQTTNSVNNGKHSDYVKSAGGSFGSSGQAYPGPMDGGLYLSPVFISDSTGGGVVRGTYDGIWAPLHPVASFNPGDFFIGTGDLAGKIFEVVKFYSGASAFMEISDTW